MCQIFHNSTSFFAIATITTTERMKIAILSFGFLWMPVARSFTLPPAIHHRQFQNTQQHSHDRELQDLEEARAAFESLLADCEHLPENVLTSTSRHRRQLEIKLLHSLEKSDDAVEELMHLWMYEHGTKAATELENMQEEVSPGLMREQAVLADMLADYPSWAEPHVRLATLLYYKGETQQSRELAKMSLKLKPWHFEAVQLLILLALRDGNMGEALSYARQSLPPVDSKRRYMWVRQAIMEAQAQWLELQVTESSITDMEAEVWQ
jgi:hypothetical protein